MTVLGVGVLGAGALCSPDCEAAEVGGGGLTASLLGLASLSPVRRWTEKVLGLGGWHGVGDPCIR